MLVVLVRNLGAIGKAPSQAQAEEIALLCGRVSKACTLLPTIHRARRLPLS